MVALGLVTTEYLEGKNDSLNKNPPPPGRYLKERNSTSVIKVAWKCELLLFKRL